MSWKSDFLGLTDQALFKDEHEIFHTNIKYSESLKFHEQYSKGAHLRKLKNEKYHQIYWETPSYIKALENFLPVDISGKLILDFGCGDGRFSEFLLSKNANKIICVDFDYNTLLSLKKFADENLVNENLLIIHSDYNNFPKLEGIYDIVLCIGVLYYLKEGYERSISTFNSSLKKDGMLITSDPDMEGFMFRGLIFDSLNEAIKIYKTRTFKETKDDTPFRFRVFDEREFVDIFHNAGFKNLEKKSISSFHNILRVLFLRGEIKVEEIEEQESEIWELLRYLDENGKLAKHYIWKLTK